MDLQGPKGNHDKRSTGPERRRGEKGRNQDDTPDQPKTRLKTWEKKTKSSDRGKDRGRRVQTSSETSTRAPTPQREGTTIHRPTSSTRAPNNRKPRKERTEKRRKGTS